MTHNLQIINSKLLLFGEYTILLGAPALAMPYKGFNGHLDFWDEDVSQTNKESNRVIKKLFDFIKDSDLSNFFELDKIKEDLEKGLYFFSDIPQGYGLGSSGALCAAMTKKYATQQIHQFSYLELKRFFSQLESFFHGKSSGTDPLVAYLDSPLFLEERKVEKVNIYQEDFKKNNLSVFLLNTLSIGDTAPLVKWFTEQLKSEGYKKELNKKYLPLLSQVIKSFIEYDNDFFKRGIKEISKYQTKLFSRMIPKEILNIWGEGNTNDIFHLKLCGSGGGGYMLGFTYLNKEQLSTVLRNKNVELTYIF